MLLQFVVENHRSFRDRAVLSMLAAPDIEHEPWKMVPGPGGRSVLRVAALYGANASGKSNLIDALQLVARLVLRGTHGDASLPMVPFKFDPESARAASHFGVELFVEGKHYSYGFEATANLVHAEWLYVVGEDGRDETVFEREAAERVPRIAIGSALSDEPERRQFLSYVAEGTRSNQLFLAEAGERNVTELDGIRAAFKNLWCIGPTASYGPLLRDLERDNAFRVRMGTLLRQAGTGVHSLEVTKKVLDEPSTELRELLQSTTNPVTIDQFRLTLDELDRVEATDVQAMHRLPSGQEFALALEEESDGTRRLLDLAPLFHFMEERQGDKVFAIDELERSLHPLLTRMFVQQFNSATGSDATQLIFTTHDTNLLGARLFSHDAIWLVEKDAHGKSVLYPLSDIDEKQIEVLEAAVGGLEGSYLQGRFGAIPFFRFLDRAGLAKEPVE